MEQPPAPNDDDFYPPADDDWFRGTPGAALSDLFTSFEEGIEAYRLLPNSSYSDLTGITRASWRALSEAYSSGVRVAQAALSLARPQDGPLTTPGEVTKGRKQLEALSSQALDELLGTSLTYSPSQSSPSLENAGGAFLVYRKALLLEVTRLLPGVSATSPYDGAPRLTEVDYDSTVHGRVRDLLKRLSSMPSSRTRKYLSSVARNYIFGFSTELAIMARVVLESHLKDVRQLPEDSRESLDALIMQCESNQELSGEALTEARDLQRLGNDAAHGRPVVAVPEDILRKLALVLNDQPRGV